MVTLEDLYTEAGRFLWENYGMVFYLEIIIDPDFIIDEAAYEYVADTGEPTAIYIAQFVMDFAHDDVIYDALRHELVHHALHMRGEDFNDGDPHFEAELKRLGVGSTLSSMVGVYYMYQCHDCDREIPHYALVTEEQIQAEGLRTHCCEAEFTKLPHMAFFDGKERLY